MENQGTQTSQAGAPNPGKDTPGTTDKTAQGVSPGSSQNSRVAPQADAGSAVKEAAAEAKRKLKIDDQEVDEEEVLKVYKERKGHQRAANKELQEGRAARKQAEEFVAMMKDQNKLIPTLEKLGYKKEDLRKLSESYLAGVLKEEMMDPREKELMETRKKLSTYEENEKVKREEEVKRQHETEKARYAAKYSEEFIEALKGTTLPATKAMVAAMAGYVARAAKLNIPMSAVEAAKLVEEDESARVEHVLRNATPEQMIKILKEEGLQKVRGYDTSRLKDPNAQLKTPEKQGEVTRKREPSGQRMSPEQWRKFNRGY